MAEQKRIAQEAIKKERAKEAGISLHNFIKSKALLSLDMDKEREKQAKLQSERDSYKAASNTAQDAANAAREAWQTASKSTTALPEAVAMLRNKYRVAAKEAERADDVLRRAEKKNAQQLSFIKSIERAKGQSKIMRANVEAAIADGLIDVTAQDLEEAASMAVSDGRVYRIGEFYNYIDDSRASKWNPPSKIVVRITGFSLNQSSCNTQIVFGSSKGQSMHIDLRALGAKTFYTESEIEIKHRLEKAGYDDVVSIVGRDDFYRQLQEKAMSEYMSVVVRTDSGFDRKRLGDIEDAALTTVVYPDKNDSKLRAEAIKFALDNADKGSTIDGAMSLLLGRDWRDIVAAADPSAPTDDDIAKWLSEATREVDSADNGINYAEVLRRSVESQSSNPALLKSVYSRRILDLMPRSPHTSRYEKVVRAFVNTQVERFESEMVGLLQQVRDRNSKIIADALADNEDTIRTRLKGAPRWMPKWVSLSSSWEDLLDKLKGSTYDGAPAVYLADLLSAGYTPYTSASDATWAVLNAEIGSSLSSLTEQASRYSDKLKKFAAGAVAQADEVTASTSGVSADDMGPIRFAAYLERKFGFTCKRNTAFCAKKPPYHWIGIHDPQGFGGKLSKTLAGNAANKELLKAVWAGKDKNGMAEHWLVPADIELDVISKVFDL